MSDLDPKAFLAKRAQATADDSMDPKAFLAKRNGVTQPQPELVQEMPDWLTTSDRLIAKNLAQSPQKQLEYLKLQHPDAEFTLDDKGQITAYKPGDKNRGVLDPDTGFFSTDILHDAGDLAYDTASGALQSAATTAAAIAGGGISGGAGALPAGMAASGASGAALEGLRQKLGQLAGIPQEVSGKDVAMSGAINTVMPAVFGTGGKVATQLAKNGLDNVAATNASRGLVTRGLEKLGVMGSGVSQDAVDAYKNNMSQVDAMGKNGIESLLDKTSTKIQNYLESGKKKAADKLSAALENTKTPVDITKAKAVITSEIEKLKALPNPNEADKQEIAALEQMYNSYFGSKPDQVTGQEAFRLQRNLKNPAKFDRGLDQQQVFIQQPARESYGAINQGLSDATDGASQEAKDTYAHYINLDNELGSKFDTAQKTYNTISGENKKGLRVLKERLTQLAEKGDLDIGNEMDQIKAWNAFYDPATLAKRNTPAAVTGSVLGGAVGWKAGQMFGAPGAGMTIGSGAGGYLGSKVNAATLREALKMAEKGRGAYNTVGGSYLLNPTAGKTLFEMMQDKDKQK